MDTWVEGMTFSELDNIRNHPIGDALSEIEPDNERGVATYPITIGTNIDEEGVETQVWYFLHDVSDEELAEDEDSIDVGDVDTTITTRSGR